MAKCYIVGAGEFYGIPTPSEGDLVIAADGGYDTLCSLGIKCDILLGDMDSLSHAAKSSDAESLLTKAGLSNTEIITFPVKKDETDTHLAYLEGVRRGYSDFELYGCVGGREDHTFANYSLLLYGKNRGHRITLVGDRREIFVIKNETKAIHGRPGATLSLFAIGGDCDGVSIKGALYEVENITLTAEFPLGVSNAFKEESVSISCGGALMVIKYL